VTAKLLRHALLAGLALMGAAPALAHHGFTGEYDYARPVYLQGTVTASNPGYPHATLTVQLTATAPPQDKHALSAVDRSEARNTSERLSLPRNLKPGQSVTILFDPVMTRQLADAGKNAPQVGQTLVAVAYERISKDNDTGELRVLHVRLADGSFLSGSRRSYHVQR
jgi:hypothetical protein